MKNRLESSIAIIAASIPTLRPLFTRTQSSRKYSYQHQHQQHQQRNIERQQGYRKVSDQAGQFPDAMPSRPSTVYTQASQRQRAEVELEDISRFTSSKHETGYTKRQQSQDDLG